jgi:antitoxin (DNA-binding transcriptional repressor) of toxin-antitoxin stability system
VKIVNAHQTKTTLSQLLADVERGEDVLIARNDTPIEKLSHVTPIQRAPSILRKFPAWSDFVYDPAVFAPF